MHEASIAENIIDIVKKQVEAEDTIGQVSLIHIKVGKLTALVPECLDFAFKAISRGTMMENAVLFIEEIQAKGKCLSCGAEFEVDSFLNVCEKCGSINIQITGGEELIVESIDIEPMETKT